MSSAEGFRIGDRVQGGVLEHSIPTLRTGRIVGIDEKWPYPIMVEIEGESLQYGTGYCFRPDELTRITDFDDPKGQLT